MKNLKNAIAIAIALAELIGLKKIVFIQITLI